MEGDRQSRPSGRATIAELVVQLHDRNGNPITGGDGRCHVWRTRPMRAAIKRSTLVQRAAGEFAGTADVPRGFWDLIIDASRDGDGHVPLAQSCAVA